MDMKWWRETLDDYEAKKGMSCLSFVFSTPKFHCSFLFCCVFLLFLSVVCKNRNEGIIHRFHALYRHLLFLCADRSSKSATCMSILYMTAFLFLFFNGLSLIWWLGHLDYWSNGRINSNDDGSGLYGR
jgi:hypothetical protein